MFRLDKAAFMTEAGEITLLKAADGYEVTEWSSSNTDIAEVDAMGKVTAVSNGDAIITATCTQGAQAQCRVSVGYHGQNPLLPPTWGLFIADGEPHVFDGRMYLYGSRDNAFGRNVYGDITFFCSDNYHVLYSDDLKHWTDAGESINARDVHAGEDLSLLWAPDVFRSPVNGRYYLTFCSTDEVGKYFIADSHQPAGPFCDAREITYDGKSIGNIDPGVLVDDDGKVYMAMPKPFRLGELDPDTDYSSIKTGSIVHVADAIETAADGYRGFEGPSLRKFNGYYYFIYIASPKEIDYPIHMNYLISKDIHSGWKFGGTILDASTYGYGINVHGSIESYNGKFYVAYHKCVPGVTVNVAPQKELPGIREMNMEEIQLSEDGSIKTAVMTSSGVRGCFLPGERISAYTAVFFSESTMDSKAGRPLCARYAARYTKRVDADQTFYDFEEGAYTFFDAAGQYNGYRYISTEPNCSRIKACVRTSAAGGTLRWRLGKNSAVMMELPDTKGQWVQVTAAIADLKSAKEELIVEAAHMPVNGYMDLDWFMVY